MDYRRIASGAALSVVLLVVTVAAQGKVLWVGEGAGVGQAHARS